MRIAEYLLRRLFLAFFVGTLTFAPASPTWAKPDLHAPVSMVEISMLPRYCLGSFHPKLATKPEQNITGCGVFMNHYCGALSAMNRANSAGLTKFEKKWLVERIRTEINYTTKNMSPTCPIASDVRNSDSRLRIMEQFVK